MYRRETKEDGRKSMMLPVVSSVWFMSKKGNLFFPVIGNIGDATKPWETLHYHGNQRMSQSYRLPKLFEKDTDDSTDSRNEKDFSNFSPFFSRRQQNNNKKLNHVEVFPFYEKTATYAQRLQERNVDRNNEVDFHWAIQSPYVDPPPPSPFFFNGVRYTPGKDMEISVDAIKKELTEKELKINKKLRNAEHKNVREIFSVLCRLINSLNSNSDFDMNIFILGQKRIYRPRSSQTKKLWHVMEEVLSRDTNENIVEFFIKEMKNVNRIFKQAMESFEKHKKSILLEKLGYDKNDILLLAKFINKFEDKQQEEEKDKKLKKKRNKRMTGRKKISAKYEVNKKISIDIQINHASFDSADELESFTDTIKSLSYNNDTLTTFSRDSSSSRSSLWSPALSTEDGRQSVQQSDEDLSTSPLITAPIVEDNKVYEEKVFEEVYEQLNVFPPLLEAEVVRYDGSYLITPVLSPAKRPIFNDLPGSRAGSSLEVSESFLTSNGRGDNTPLLIGDVELAEGDIVITPSFLEEHQAAENIYVSSRLQAEENVTVNETPLHVEQNRNRLMRKINNRVSHYNRTRKKSTAQHETRKTTTESELNFVKVKSLVSFKKALSRVMESRESGRMNDEDLSNLRKEYESIDIHKLTGFKKVEAMFLLYPKEYQIKADNLLRRTKTSNASERIEKRAHRASSVDYISNYQRIDTDFLQPYLRSFTVFDEDEDGIVPLEMLKEILFGVQKLEGTSEKYLHLLNEVLQLNTITKITFRMFAVIATLLEKMIMTRTITKDVMSGMNALEVDRKITFFRDMFYSSGSDNENFISIEQLRLEFAAGGLSREKEENIIKHIQVDDCGDVSFMDYMAYIPLFITIHNKIVENALDDSRDA